MNDSVIYDASAIRAILPSGADAVCIKETESTNTIAREYISNGVASGTVILADTQTAGRGRRGNTFYSPEGGIYMSIIVRDEEGVPYTVCAASAVCKTLRAFGVDAKIKWVNDVFVGGKKVCGILCERVDGFIIIGIGINHSVKAFPEELKDTAASLPKSVPNMQKTVCAVTKQLFNSLANVADAKAYYAKNMMLYGKRVLFDFNGAKHSGTVIGLGKNAELLIETDGGNIIINSGVVTLC